MHYASVVNLLYHINNIIRDDKLLLVDFGNSLETVAKRYDDALGYSAHSSQ